MKLSKSLSDMVRFANWCSQQHLMPLDAAHLILLARRYYHAAVRACNRPGQTAREQRAGNRLEVWANNYGFAVEYRGLWPSLRRLSDREEVHIPDVGG